MDNNHICWIWIWMTSDSRSKVVCELCFTLTGTLCSPTHVNWHLSLAGTDKVDLRVSEHWLSVMSQLKSHPSESQTVLGWKIPPLWNNSLSLTVSCQLFEANLMHYRPQKIARFLDVSLLERPQRVIRNVWRSLY